MWASPAAGGPMEENDSIFGVAKSSSHLWVSLQPHRGGGFVASGNITQTPLQSLLRTASIPTAPRSSTFTKHIPQGGTLGRTL